MSNIKLKSEIGADYTKLRDLLAAQQWLESDTETLYVMLSVSKISDRDYVGISKSFFAPTYKL